jgi:HK97 gp10 family phage protein
MADGMTGTMQGVEALEAKLKIVKGQPRAKSTRFALRKGANVVRDQAKANAQSVDDPTTPTSIAANIVVRNDNRHLRQNGEFKMRVGVLGGAKGHAAASGELKGKGSSNPGGDTYYWRFLEFGTQHMAARPFMRPAMTQTTGPAIDEFATQFEKALTRAIRKANKAKR